MKNIVSKVLTIVDEIEEDKIRAHLVSHMMWSIFHNENNKTNRIQLQICNDDLIFENRIYVFLKFLICILFSFLKNRKWWKQWEKHGTRITLFATDHARNQCRPCHSLSAKESHTVNRTLRNCSPQNVRPAKIQLRIKQLSHWTLNGIRIASHAE